MTSKQGRHLPPSRVRYQQQHPVISIRVTRETKDELEALRGRGTSWRDILSIGLGRQAAANRNAKELEEQAFRSGFEKARARYRVVFRCHLCDKPIEAVGDQLMAEVVAALEEKCFAHGECIQRERSVRYVVRDR